MPPALNPFNPDMHMLSPVSATADTGDVSAGSAVMIWSMAVARLSTDAKGCLADGAA